MNSMTAGVVAGLVLALSMAAFMFVRGEAFAEIIFAEANIGNLTARQSTFIMMGMGIVLSLLFGLLAGFVYEKLGSTQTFHFLALGLAVLFTVAAFLVKTPLPWDKTIMNFMTALALGALVPLLSV